MAMKCYSRAIAGGGAYIDTTAAGGGVSTTTAAGGGDFISTTLLMELNYSLMEEEPSLGWRVEHMTIY